MAQCIGAPFVLEALFFYHEKPDPFCPPFPPPFLVGLTELLSCAQSCPTFRFRPFALPVPELELVPGTGAARFFVSVSEQHPPKRRPPCILLVLFLAGLFSQCALHHHRSDPSAQALSGSTLVRCPTALFLRYRRLDAGFA